MNNLKKLIPKELFIIIFFSLRKHEFIVFDYDKQLCMCRVTNNDETLTSGKSGILTGFDTMNVQHNDTP